MATGAAEAPEGFVMIEEGQAKSLFPAGNEVFYNKVQVLNRDVSIQVMRLFVQKRAEEMRAKAKRKAARRAAQQAESKASEASLDTSSIDLPPGVFSEAEQITVLDALAASGLRSVRYLKECEGIAKVVINDLEPAAVELANRNIEFNQVDPTKAIAQQGDAVLVLLNHREADKQFDVIDLDPYGSAAPFLDAAVQAVKDGGLLCVTCTDAAVLTGVYPETCFAKYGTLPVKGKFHHEQALRVLLHSIDSHANIYGRHIVPVVSLAIDFYVRVFVRVYTSKSEVKNSCLRRGYVYQSMDTPEFYVHPMGRMAHNKHQAAVAATPPAEGRYKIGGPIWSAPIHDGEWVAELLRRVESGDSPCPIPTQRRLTGLITAVSEELLDVPLYYSLPELAATIHSSCPKMKDMQAALMNAGFRVSQQHKEPYAVKTDAPPHVVWDILRCWVRANHPELLEKAANTPDDLGYQLLLQEPVLQADFTLPDVLKQEKARVARFPPNPEENWGPKSRARSSKNKKGAAADQSEATDQSEQQRQEEEHAAKRRRDA